MFTGMNIWFFPLAHLLVHLLEGICKNPHIGNWEAEQGMDKVFLPGSRDRNNSSYASEHKFY
ncbi:hypothetical protein ACFL6S_36775, partial [Candidatus Poribacteria bacterium]